jgi:lipopolysaccharide/colanic/teichoic acid biosynthesis glycosyltransferase
MKNVNISNMIISNKKEKFFLLVGDLFIFAFSLWLSLALREGFVGLWANYVDLIVPFTYIFGLWILVFFIAGLYDKYTTILKDSMSGIIFNAQLINSGIAIAFFYLLPYFGVAPKTILFLDLVVALILVYSWRIYSHSLLGLKRKEPSILIGSGEEMESILKEINNNSRSELKFILEINLDKQNDTSYVQKIIQTIKTENISVIVIDLNDKRIESILPVLYNQIFSGVKFVDIDKVYEDVFDRAPLSFLEYDWFLENISLKNDMAYNFIKRFFDITISIILGIFFCVMFPFVALAIKIEDGGSIFFFNNMTGKNGKPIKIVKFRSMSVKEKEKITKVGMFLRKTRVDEFPQVWNVLRGDLSLIGPRPEKQDLVRIYEEEIPYYDVRYLVTPGLSGWAQIWQENPPKYGVDFNNTKVKLSYDLYYVKNRSLILDLNIGLKTIKDLLSRRGK